MTCSSVLGIEETFFCCRRASATSVSSHQIVSEVRANRLFIESRSLRAEPQNHCRPYGCCRSLIVTDDHHWPILVIRPDWSADKKVDKVKHR